MFWNKLTNFFTIKDSENYCAAIDKMSLIRDNISDVLVVMPDVTVAELVFVRDKWQELPSNLGLNVRVMGLHITKDIKTILTEFMGNSEIYGHEHTKNHELIHVLDGSIDIMINNQKLTLNENDMFIIYKNELHSIISNSGAKIVNTYYTNLEDLSNDTEHFNNIKNKFNF